MSRARMASLGLFVVAGLCALLATAIRFVSDAHGHGLASGDRTMIVALWVTAAVCTLGAGVAWGGRGR